ncbi:hypothetical protein GS501_00635 [Saccharibacter sp. 17.LH.SD]|uniref:hypothetical protein n=1 Tax=Saccharibacter sp. 17.LH.SD TaxID=2689393 RepID=UPI001369D913|nr:hypothetical protein [Saccharibacter sp. 17.LH.SD]MXV43585.1 hypothetical protein [Saccharibacter sp. 17.LH.SD]
MTDCTLPPPQTTPLSTLPRYDTPSEEDAVLGLVQTATDPTPRAVLIPRHVLQGGKKGDPGLNTYQLAVLQGYTGSLDDWLASIRGVPGPPGQDAYEVAVKQGFQGTRQDWLHSLIGPKGDTGQDAYQLAVQQGFQGTEEEWLKSLVGPKGDRGDPGENAYEVAVQQGFQGTEQEWLQSLIGPKGDQGNPGDNAYQVAVQQGFQGTKADWLKNLIGPKGDPGDNAYNVALQQGFQGSEQDWLKSLVGPRGNPGPQVSLIAPRLTTTDGVTCSYLHIYRDGGAGNLETLSYPNGVSYQFPPFVQIVTHRYSSPWDGSQVAPLTDTGATSATEGPRIISVGAKEFVFQHPGTWPGYGREVTTFIIWGVTALS